MTFCDFLHFYERLLYKMTHFYERLWALLLAVVGIIPRTGSDEEIRLEVRGTDKKNELENPTHFSYFLPFAGSIAAAIQPAVGICLSAKRLLLLKAVGLSRHIPMRGSH